MSHQVNYNGPSALNEPLDFLCRMVRGFILWPIVGGISMMAAAPFIIAMAGNDSRATKLILTAAVLCVWSPGVAMACAFAHTRSERLWGHGRGRPPEQPSRDLPTPPEDHGTPEPVPPVVVDDVIPPPEWFDTPAPTELEEVRMSR